jgi:signal transduction histidine kinase/CheY-like chemotaxis protein
MAFLYLFGLDLWPAVALSLFGFLVLRGGNIPLDFGVTLGDTLEAFLGAYFLKYYVELHPLLYRLRDSLGMIVACIMPSLLAAAIIEGTQFLLGSVQLSTFLSAFGDLWSGHAVSALTFAPLLIRWLYRPFFYKTRGEIIEGIFLFGSVIALNVLIFWTPYGTIGSVSLIYVLFIAFIWAALRAGPRGTTLALALTGVIDATAAIYGTGPLHKIPAGQAEFAVQIFLGLLGVIFLMFVSIVEERKEASIQLRSNVNELERAIEKIKFEDQAKTNFLAILAHELRNPLSPIVTCVELLKEDITEPRQRESLDTIESHARTISFLLDDLLDISRITQNRLELRRERVSLQQMVRRSVESVNRFIQSQKHTLEVLVPDEEVLLDGDPVRIEQIIVNLLNNAAKYTDPGGKITLSAVAVPPFASITVADTGIGIAPEKLPGVFEPFGQQGAVVRQPGGLGVGLSLSKRLAEMHGGSIEAKSPGLGAGSSFTVFLPLATGVPSAGRSRNFVNRLRGTAGGAKKKVLIVDDNIPAAEGLASLLKRRGHTVTVAHTGADALEAVQKQNPDCVVLDIGLPDTDGYEVAKKIRAASGPLPKLIALTGYGQEDDKQKSRDAGFDAHLTKPVSADDVEAVL